ncbi:hypothetical protein NC99_39040 [Sunxiuqinia dokdonensis]|uniref:Uncharacterized protein n=1 Tax=Sunxiuqinia dokdonensis TaxID=1409788 RepID=A0A0L8V4C2_9BACT|nr:hypothetical protein NC99_39040 [Sunxiuqinia dokdonensis]
MQICVVPKLDKRLLFLLNLDQETPEYQLRNDLSYDKNLFILW